MRPVQNCQTNKTINIWIGFPIAWKMHPVISVVQLKPLPPGEMENDIPTYQSYEIDKLIDKRVRRYNKTNVTKYLIKWLKYGPEYGRWKSFSVFNDCLKLVKKDETALFILAKNDNKRRNDQGSH